MRNIYEILETLEEGYFWVIENSDTCDIEHAEEFAMDGLTVEEMEEYDAVVAQVLREFKKRLPFYEE